MSDSLAWVIGTSENSWIKSVCDLKQSIFFKDVYTNGETIKNNYKVNIKLDPHWKGALEEGEYLISFPLFEKGKNVGMILANIKTERMEFMKLIDIEVFFNYISNIFISDYQIISTYRDKMLYHKAVKLVDSFSKPSHSSQLESLCQALRKILKADYVDICERNFDRRFTRRARSTILKAKIKPSLESVKCKFREQACDQKKGVRFIENDTRVSPIIAGSVEKIAFRTSVGKSIISISTENESVVGALTVGFKDRRILSYMEQVLIDEAAQLSLRALNGLKRGDGVKELIRKAIRVTSIYAYDEQPQKLVELLADFLEIKYCSFSQLKKKAIRSIAFVGYDDLYGAVEYKLGEGKTGHIVQNKKILCHHRISNQFEYYNSVESKYEPANFSDVKNKEKCFSYVSQNDKIRYFLGIPMTYSNRNEVFGCIKLLAREEDPEITQESIHTCVEIGSIFALLLSLAEKKDDISKMKAKEYATKITLEEKRRHIRAMSHDWDTPIKSLAFDIADLKYAASNTDIDLMNIIENMNEQVDYLDSLMKFGKKAGNINVSRININLTKEINSIVHNGQRLTPSINFHTDYSSIERTIFFDKSSLQIIIYNYIKNANEANAYNITIKIIDNENNYLIMVLDDGDGVCTDADIWSFNYSTKNLSSESRGNGLALTKVRAEINGAEAFGPSVICDLTAFSLEVNKIY